ncbi:MAG: hypothetical protein ACRBFS_19540 [Aureispira sp.]
MKQSNKELPKTTWQEQTSLKELLKAIKVDQDPNEEETLGIEHSKQVITLGVGIVADIIMTVQKNDIKGFAGGTFKVIGRFADDFASAVKILRKLKELWSEVKDWDSQEGEELREHQQHETWGAFEERGLEAKEEALDLVNAWLSAFFLTVAYSNQYR